MTWTAACKVVQYFHFCWGHFFVSFFFDRWSYFFSLYFLHSHCFSVCFGYLTFFVPFWVSVIYFPSLQNTTFLLSGLIMCSMNFQWLKKNIFLIYFKLMCHETSTEAFPSIIIQTNKRQQNLFLPSFRQFFIFDQRKLCTKNDLFKAPFLPFFLFQTFPPYPLSKIGRASCRERV